MLTNCAAKVIKNGKRKAENGKLFIFRLERESGPLLLS